MPHHLEDSDAGNSVPLQQTDQQVMYLHFTVFYPVFLRLTSTNQALLGLGVVLLLLTFCIAMILLTLYRVKKGNVVRINRVLGHICIRILLLFSAWSWVKISIPGGSRLLR
jgi:threonine/homoserine/homoserine lactone efflux protein